MISTLSQVYKTSVFLLAETLILKHHAAALIMNEYVQARGYAVTSDPSTWKYYLNISGQYHQCDLDDLSLVNPSGSPYILIKTASPTGSVDTAFTRTLLDGNISLANEYTYDSVYFQELLTRYKNYELLIRGIRYPIATAVALAASEGDILYCGGWFRHYATVGGEATFIQRTTGINDGGLIEPQEQSLLPKLQQWITAFLIRWYNVDYNKTDDLHLTSLLGILYSNIPIVVNNIRLAMCHTPETHTYHIKAFLESNGKLSKYVPDLPLREVLFLYRNIRYIVANIGKQSTFDLLLDNLATPSGVSLYGYEFRHNLGSQPEELVPDPFLKRIPLNYQNVGGGKPKLSVAEMLDKERFLARDNGVAIEQTGFDIYDAAAAARGNRQPTKYIESVMTDTVERDAYPLSKVLFHNWVYTASHGLYNGTIGVTHPVSGDRILMTPLSALVLLFYCFNRGYSDITLDTVPVINALFIPRNDYAIPSGYSGIPTLSQQRVHTLTSDVSDAMLTELTGSVPPTVYYNSNDAFYSGSVAAQAEMTRRYRVVGTVEDFRIHGQMQMAMHTHYWLSVPCELAPAGQNYEAWFTDNAIALGTLTRQDYMALGTQLLKQGTGVKDGSTRKLQRLQTAVMEILKQLSSYSVQYNYSINDRPALTTNTSTLRLSNYRSSARVKVFVRMPVMSVNKIVVRPRPQLVRLDTGLTPVTTIA